MKRSEGSEKVMQMSTSFYFSLITGKKALYSGHKVGVIFIDFRKAFDCVRLFDCFVLSEVLLVFRVTYGLRIISHIECR